MRTPHRRYFMLGLALLMSYVLIGCAYMPRYTAAETPWIKPLADSRMSDPGIARLIKQNPQAFLAEARRRHDETVSDYQCRLVRIERLGAELAPEQQIQVDYRREPHSVYMQWLTNAAGAERVLYVEGQRDGHMLALPVMVGWLTGPVKVDPQGDQALKHTRKPITEFGFGRTLSRLLKAYETGRVSDNRAFRDHYVGLVEVDGRCAYQLERVLAKDAAIASDSVHGWRICFDCETLLPVAVTEFDGSGQVLGDYLFTDIKLNPGLDSSAFTEQRLRSKK